MSIHSAKHKFNRTIQEHPTALVQLPHSVCINVMVRNKDDLAAHIKHIAHMIEIGDTSRYYDDGDVIKAYDVTSNEELNCKG